MAFKPVSTNAIDLKKSKDVPYTGEFVGKDDITTQLGPQIIWKFVGKDGGPFGIYGFTHLNLIMKNIKVGALCRVTYKGTIKRQTKFGLKDVHQALVEVDDETAPEVAAEEEQEPGF